MITSVPKEEHDRRMEICKNCPQYWVNGLNVSRCKMCGCFLEAKTRFAGQHCPINKW